MAKLQLNASNRKKVTVLASTISAILSGGVAYRAVAQEASTADEVVVTGSRIVRRDLDAATPIMTVDTERLENTSTISVESVLNQMPQFTPAQSQFSAQGQIQTSPTASLGIGTVNLRGVGTNRTLVLIDGRRAQSANASLVVDLNSVPSAAIARVETITGGASAVYGADALAGVVNFVLKDNFEGVSVDAQTSVTEAGDGEESRFSSLIGLNSSSGHANILLGVEWYERDVAYQKNRDFFTKGWNDPANTTSTFLPSMAAYNIDANNRPTQASIDALFPQYPAGTVNVNAATPPVIFFNPDGSAWTRNATRALGFNDALLGRPDIGDGYYGLIRQGNRIEQIYQDGALSTPLERRSAFAKGHVDLTDNLRAFVQANYSSSEVTTYSAGPPPAYNTAWGGAIPNDGRTSIPGGLQSLLNTRRLDPDGSGPAPAGAPGSGAGGTWFLTRGLDFAGNFGPSNESNVYQIMAGVEGSFPDRDWTWEAYYSSGKTSATNVYYGLPSVQKWKALVASPEFGRNQVINYATDPNGAPILDANGNRIPVGGGEYQLRCTSGLPIFSGTTASTTSDCLSSIIGPYKSASTVTQDILEANLQGKIADLRAGELRFAAGVSNRKNGFVYEPANASSSVFDYPLGIFASNPAQGETKVSELYGELLVPVTQRFDVSLGYRYSDYDSAAGEVGTYKAEFDWKANDWMRLRAGYQVANRAPNTAELFQSETNQFQGTFSSADPCAVTTLIPGFGNRPDNPNRLQVQQICAQLITDYPTPGSAAANSYMEGTVPFTGINAILVGNPTLTSEEAKTWTVGAVFTAPGGIDGLTASLDFYNIEITGAIANFDGQTIYNKCFNRDGRSNPGWSINDPGGFCGLIDRSDGAGTATGIVQAPYLNTGFITTAGVDMAVNWDKDLAGGTFYVNNLLTFLDEFKTQATLTDPVLEYADTLGQGGQYKYRLNSTVGYRFGGGNASVGLRWRYLPEVKNAAYVTNRATTTRPTDSYSTFDLFAGYTFNERYQLRGGIDNVFDVDPAIVGATPTDSNSASTNSGYYDVLGPRLYVGLKIQF
jgi:outer membrane receptor protein involved in Fe transport